MEEQMLIYLLLDEEEEWEEKRIRRSQLRFLRDSSDPFMLPEAEFVKNFRLNKVLCHQLIEELRPHDSQPTSIDLSTRVLASLHFLGHGSYQKCVGNNCNLPMSQPSVSRALRAVTKLIVHVKHRAIRCPRTVEEENSIKAKFYSRFGIKGTNGAIDCTHVAIVAPPSNVIECPLNLYMNRKGFYSINVEAVCDSDLSFTFINPKFPGATHDSGIWATSEVRELLMKSHNRQRESWLIGDQGYPLEPWILIPLSNPQTEKELKYNKLHASSRNTIERAFGVLKTRFRCLSKHRVLHYSHQTAATIISACAILHNMLIKACAPQVEPAADDDVADVVTNNGSQFTAEGDRIRRRYINQL